MSDEAARRHDRLAGNLVRLQAIRLLFWTHFISAILVLAVVARSRAEDL